MSNLITEGRVAIMAAIAANLTTSANDEKFAVIAGSRDGVSRDRNLACVFAPPMVSDGANINFANPSLVVRAWVKQPKPPKSTSPQDPEPVEQLMIDLATVLAPFQKPETRAAYWIVQELIPDYQDWGVQATLIGWAVNPATPIP